MSIGERNRKRRASFTLQAQHSESDLENVGNLCDEPEGCSAIFAGDFFQHIDFPGSSTVRSINTATFFAGTCRARPYDKENSGNISDTLTIYNIMCR